MARKASWRTTVASNRRSNHPHDPDVHTSPVSHAVPQLPQLLPSVARVEHEPEQSTMPAAHPHTPVVQTALPPQLVPHRPQFSASLCRSVHVAPPPPRPVEHEVFGYTH
jgi:hypothetical protein